MDDDEICQECGGTGMVLIEVPITECCGNALKNGECCGNGIEGHATDWQPCDDCDGTGVLT